VQLSAPEHFDVVYFFEHAARELDVACAVTHLLRERGLRATIVQWPHGFHRVASLRQPKVVALPFCYTESSFATCLLEWRTAAYFNVAWEQLFYPGNEKAKRPRGAFATRHVVHHAWGDFNAAKLEGYGIPAQNIFVNGHPAYQLYELPYAAYFADRASIAERLGLSAEKRWVFFPENYNWAFYSAEMLRRFLAAGQRAADIEAMRAFCETSLHDVLGWCVDLVRNGDVELIVRPRPATPAAEFRAHAESVIGALPPGMHILQDGTVREWIRASDVVVSSHSTSLIEAAIAGKPAYMLAPQDMPAALAVEWHATVKKIHTAADLMRVVAQSDAADSSALTRWAKNRVMSHGDAIRNLADQIAAMAAGVIPLPPAVSRADATPLTGRARFAFAGSRSLLYEARRIVHRRNRRSPSPAIAAHYLPDIAGEREVEQRIARWREILSSGQHRSAGIAV
jgi:surface carbohydrate biosynthesis protein